ncbi:unnamed protein product [Acanthoscelides obtectus]|uniref:Uncharacterized protein n=1 Tax=Acanthoscelides obtectus TaxID=200917 RepID=A0A9P0JS30_ACAOB|nr:unnamed protein product [Acanthoscelides obtectus]CAK1637396.1 hypothetical protein AOBTE_LOCUS9950 [Acanthoscelides obtectus]
MDFEDNILENEGSLNDETTKDEQDFLTHPFSEDGNSDSSSDTESTKSKRRRPSRDCTEDIDKTEDIKFIRDSTDSEEEPTAEKVKIKKKIRLAMKKHKVHPPRVNESKFEAFLDKLKTKPKVSKQRRNQLECIHRLHSIKNPMWTSPSAVLKAVRDCILNRKWNNLTHLVLILINFPSHKYKPLIKNLCLLIDKLHPMVQDNNMEGQFKLVYQAARRRY